MAQSSAPEAGEAAAQARAKILEGVDFIETEEDAEAVESAVVKIQSTFRGKKIRSKLGGAQSKQPATTSASASTSASTKTANAESASNSTRASDSKQTSTDTKKPSEAAAASAKQAADEELNKRVAKMQVNDNSDAHEPQKGNNQPALLEDEAERAATKIQAGFKGYKTRKELEGKLGGQQQAPPTGSQQQQ